MKGNVITIRQSIHINKPREFVWDYTQNYDNRTLWDPAVRKATILQTSPNRVVKLRTKGNTTMTLIYKLDERPSKTTLVAQDISSPIIQSAGGFWTYHEQDGETLWEQSNTIILKNYFIFKLLMPLYKWLLTFMTRKAMQKAKQKIESFV